LLPCAVLRTCTLGEASLLYSTLAVVAAKLFLVDEDNDIVDRLVKLAVEAFDIAARRTSLSEGDIFTVPVAIPGGGDEASIVEVLQRLSKLGYTAAYTTGSSSFTVTSTNRPGSTVVNDSEALREIMALLGKIVELQSKLLQKSTGFSRAEVIGLTSLIWAILYGVLRLITGG
jgi:hypothetical protein